MVSIVFGQLRPKKSDENKGLTVGLGKHVKDVSKPDLRNFQIVGHPIFGLDLKLTFCSVTFRTSERQSTMSALRQDIDPASLHPFVSHSNFQTCGFRRK